MSEIYFLRHGQSQSNVENRLRMETMAIQWELTGPVLCCE
jgi:Fructose-2,6-bisphosphatase